MKNITALFLALLMACGTQKSKDAEFLQLTATTIQGKINFGENPGFYQQYLTAFGGTGSADSIYMLAYRAGCRSLRVSVSYANYEQYGTFTPQFQFMGSKFSNNTFFLDVAETDYKARGTTKLSNGAQTWMPIGLYDSALNPDGTINVNNKWGKYCYDMAIANGPYVTHAEVWNEPDLTPNWQASSLPTSKYAGSWETNEPLATDLVNLNATVSDYVQLCKVAYQIWHKFAPNCIISTGGISNPYFYMWFLKHGGGSWIDEVSQHFYPIYCWTYFTTFATARRNSNYAVFRTDSNRILLYNDETAAGIAHKPFQWTEVNINRWSRPGNASSIVFPNNKEFGNDVIQRNFDIKIVLKEFQAGAQGFHFFATLEAADSGDQSNVNYSMGLYKNGNKAGTIGKEQKTQAGIGTTFLQNITQNYVMTPASITTSTIDGTVLDSAGTKMYVVWDNNMNVDTTENHSTIYTLPAGNWNRINWDGSSAGIVSGTVTVTMDPSYFTLASGSTPPQPPVIKPISVTISPVNPILSAPVSAITLTASVANPNAGSTITYSWSCNNSVVTLSPSTNILLASNLPSGQTIFTVTAKDNFNQSSTMTTTVTLNPAPVKTTTGIKVQKVNSSPSSSGTQITLIYSDGTSSVQTVAKGFTYEVTYSSGGKFYANVEFSDGSIVTYQ